MEWRFLLSSEIQANVLFIAFLNEIKFTTGNVEGKKLQETNLQLSFFDVKSNQSYTHRCYRK